MRQSALPRNALLGCILAVATPMAHASLPILPEVVRAKEVYLVGEPVVIEIRQSNSTANAQRVCTSFDIGFGIANYYVADDATNFALVPASAGFDPVTEFVTLQPGQTHCSKQILLYSGRNDSPMLFARPGQYSVVVEIPMGGTSNPVRTRPTTVRIVAPQRKDDIAASASMNDIEVVRGITPWVHMISEKAIRTLEEVAAGRSAYATYAGYFLGTLPDMDPQKRLKWLDKADIDGSVVQDLVVLQRSVAFASAGDVEGLKGQISRIRRDFPCSAALSKIDLEGYGARLLTQAETMRGERSKRSVAVQLRPVESKDTKMFTEQIESFLRAYWRGDSKACLATMTEDFVSGHKETREEVAARFTDDAKEMAKYRPSIDITARNLMTDGTNVVGTFDVVAKLGERGGKQPMEFGFRNVKGRWQITFWKELDTDEKRKEKEDALRELDEADAKKGKDTKPEGGK